MNLRSRSRKHFSRGRWAVERERGRLSYAAQPSAYSEPLRVGDAMDSVLRGLRLAERDWQEEILQAWVELAGPAVARHARPGRITGTCLTVFVDSPVWQAELTRTTRGILLQALQRRFGAARIASLRFAADPDGRAPGAPPISGG